MMESQLSGLFGGGTEGETKAAKANDFVKRVHEGKADEGFSTDEAVNHLNQLLPHANSAQVERATKTAISNMPANQQAEFGQFVQQLKTRKSGGAAGGTNVDVNDISKMFGQAGGSASNVNDLFGSLGGLLGGGTSGTSSGGFMGMLMNLLGGLFGGNRSQSTAGGADVGSLLGSTTGKVLMGGIAAALINEMAGNH
jgi:hypothetical protein